MLVVLYSGETCQGQFNQSKSKLDRGKTTKEAYTLRDSLRMYTKTLTPQTNKTIDITAEKYITRPP